MGFDPYQFAALKIQIGAGGGLPIGYFSGSAWKGGAAPQRVKGVVEPTHRLSEANTGVAQPKVKEVNETTNNSPDAHVAGQVVLHILAYIPPIEIRRGIG